MKVALLRGRDHAAIGAVGEAGEGPVALALSRGGAAKPYPHVDPNEDAAACVHGTHGLLVAVADGHWGVRGAELAIESLLAAAAEAWTEGRERSPDEWYQEALGALAAANEAVLGAQGPEQRSRTTLSVGLARPARNLLVAASLGDSHLFRVGARAAVDCAGAPRGRRLLFVGQQRLTTSALEREARIEIATLDDCEALVAATDGLSEEGIGVADPARTVHEALSAARTRPADERAAAAARGVVEAALAAHRTHAAGDNVAAAVAWLAG